MVNTLKNKKKIALELEADHRGIPEIEGSGQLLEALYINLPIGIYIVQDRRFQFTNFQFQKITGYGRDELLGRHSLDIVLPEDRPMVKKNIIKMLKGELFSPYECRVITGSGAIKWIMETVAFVQYRERRALLGNLMDITEHKRMEEALAQEVVRRRILIEQSSDGIVILDQDGKVFEANQRFAEMLGYTPGEVLQLHVWDWDTQWTSEQLLDMIHSVSADGDHFETYHQRKDGTIYDVEISTNGATFAEQKLVFCVCRDVTEHKQKGEELKKALANLEHANAQLVATNKEMEAFSYSVSHDLRSPLRTIDGFSQALLEDYVDRLDENGQDYLNRLRAASQKMGQLIDGLLKLSRLTRSEMRGEMVDLSALAKEIADNLQETQPERRVEFIIGRGLSDRGDRQLLRVLLENLLGNAWKFTGKCPEARIEFGAARNGGQKAYFVRDNGAGFDMAYAGKLFGAFQRLHETTEFPGTGIGLATAQRIINRHGGRIWAEGEVGKGATFYFTLS